MRMDVVCYAAYVKNFVSENAGMGKVEDFAKYENLKS